MEFLHDLPLLLLSQVFELHRLCPRFLVPLSKRDNQHNGLGAVIQDLLQHFVMIFRSTAPFLVTFREWQASFYIKVDLEIEIRVSQGLPDEARGDELWM